MDFMSFLTRLWAILLGSTVLPLRILANNALYAMAAFLLGIVLVIDFPIKVAINFKNMGVSSGTNFLLSTLIVFPLVAIIITAALAVATAYLTYNTVINVLESFWLGFKNGLFYGMDGFWSALDSQSLFDPSLYLSAFQGGVSPDQLIDDVDFDGFQRVPAELRDVEVVHEDLEVPDLQDIPPKIATKLLSDIEFKKIDELINLLSLPKEPLRPEIKRKLDVLKTLYTQYKDLTKKLEDVRTALVEGDKSKIKDEMIAYNEVETPILLVKQYKDGEKWHNVPAASYVTDKGSLLRWLKLNPKHTLLKDFLKTPDPYNKKETKYIWYELTKDDCSSQELDEAAVEMRVLANTLLPLLSEQQKLDLEPGSSPQSFFVLGVHDNSDLSHDKVSAINPQIL
ncbi:coiled coil protein [Legionella steigerwaltii]|uniref:Coiled coil protein n=2 Tax=Legionella steigerwaltii TaxID=460 RepID=A0A378LBL5_9GAMM|nr:coiled coil protein [Legionella steigerwaltii]STY24213.1 coiled coil protein [Legionella steigerwaltii]